MSHGYVCSFSAASEKIPIRLTAFIAWVRRTWRRVHSVFELELAFVMRDSVTRRDIVTICHGWRSGAA